ncbi:MAG: hypothetical protein KAI47_17640, partial [Deltaproteobacteria bacterium]|nr:hypothetical protein [Deltaproteobacteria bacterium]
ARGPALFQDPGNKTGRLGPLGFRCFAQGFDCGVNDPATVGVRKKCKRRDDYLTSVESFVRFFKGLKTNPEKLIVAAISGPSTTIEVTRTNEGEPYLEPSCKIDVIDDDTGRLAGGAPALRLNALVEALDGQVTPICDKDFGTALKRLGEKIIASLGGQCIRKPLLLKNGGVACQAGVAGCRMPVCGVDERCDETRGRCVDALGNETAKHCGASCLDAADCLVEELRNKGAENEVRVPLERCPREIFVNASLPKDACGTHCPCWRIVPRGEQCQRIGATPFGFEVMRHGDAPPDTVAIAYCRTASFPWESPTVAEAKTHCSAPRF